MDSNNTHKKNTPTPVPADNPSAPPFVYQQPYTTLPAKREKPVYATLERVFAFLCVLSGFLFARLVLWGALGVSAFAFFIITLTLTYVYIKRCGLSFTFKDYIVLCVLLLFSTNFILSANGFIKFLNLVFLLLAGAYFVYAKAVGMGKIRRGFFYDLLNSLFIVPFCCFFDCPRAVSQSMSKKGKTFKWALLGLVIAVPVTTVAAVLLFSSDEMFRQMYAFSFDEVFLRALTFCLQFMLGLPLAFWFFGALYGIKSDKAKSALPPKKAQQFSKSIKIIPGALFYAVLIPLCVLYVLYFIAQSGYFLSAFQNLLPQGFSYAEYARQGFFELFAVALLNLGVIGFVFIFCKRAQGQLHKSLKGVCILLCFFTLLLIATALRKMVLYIDFYGLTQLRLYTSWFMLLCASIFLILIFKLFFKKLNFPRIAVTVFVVFLAVLSFANTDALIAKYNVESYKQDKIGWMGTGVLSELDDSAVRYILPLMEDDAVSADIKSDCNDYLQRVCNRQSDAVLHFNLTSYNANALLTDAGYTKDAFIPDPF